MSVRHLIFLAFAALVFCCSNENPVTPVEGDTYTRLVSAESGNTRFEIWSASSTDTLMTGYNKIGFKVFENNQEKTSGFVKYFARMYHFGGGNMHSTPVEPVYNYNSSLGMFAGYFVLLMPSDTTSNWYGFYNYSDQLFIDSARFDIKYNSKTKFKIFVDLSTSLSYLITVISPVDPARGPNSFKIMLHESFNFINFTQVRGAQMYLRTWLDSLQYSSAQNVNPVDNNGIYEGQINFDYSGLWNVHDSIYYNNKLITATDPPSIVFRVP